MLPEPPSSSFPQSRRITPTYPHGTQKKVIVHVHRHEPIQGQQGLGVHRQAEQPAGPAREVSRGEQPGEEDVVFLSAAGGEAPLEVLAEAGIDPGVIFADIDPSLSKQAREKVPSLQHDQSFTNP